jgi:hypothetical protein
MTAAVYHFTDTVVARERYGRHPRTLVRWSADPELGFPPAIKIRNRLYRDSAQLDARDLKNSLRAAEGK